MHELRSVAAGLAAAVVLAGCSTQAEASFCERFHKMERATAAAAAERLRIVEEAAEALRDGRPEVGDTQAERAFREALEGQRASTWQLQEVTPHEYADDARVLAEATERYARTIAGIADLHHPEPHEVSEMLESQPPASHQAKLRLTEHARHVCEP